MVDFRALYTKPRHSLSLSLPIEAVPSGIIGSRYSSTVCTPQYRTLEYTTAPVLEYSIYRAAGTMVCALNLDLIELVTTKFSTKYLVLEYNTLLTISSLRAQKIHLRFQ